MEHWKIAFIWGVYAFHFFSAPLIIQMWNILPRLQTLYIGRLFFFQFIYFVRYRTQRFSYEVNFFSPLANQAALARVIGSHMSSFLKLKSNNNLLAISIHLAGLFLCSLTFTLSHSHMLATFQFGNFNGRWRKLWKNTIKIHWWLMFGSNSFSIWNCELR